jgi:hypothetical protein
MDQLEKDRIQRSITKSLEETGKERIEKLLASGEIDQDMATQLARGLKIAIPGEVIIGSGKMQRHKLTHAECTLISKAVIHLKEKNIRKIFAAEFARLEKFFSTTDWFLTLYTTGRKSVRGERRNRKK